MRGGFSRFIAKHGQGVFRLADTVHPGGEDAPGIPGPLPAGKEAPEVALAALVPADPHGGRGPAFRCPL